MISLTLLAELFVHQAWADAELLRAVSGHPQASSDERLLGTLHHIVLVQRLFAAMLVSTAFDMEQEKKSLPSLSALQEMSSAVHARLLAFVTRIGGEEPGTLLENPRMPDLKSTMGETLMHVILHSQNHRGQCLVRLRELTGEAPTLDFLMWVKLGRPQPVHLSGIED